MKKDVIVTIYICYPFSGPANTSCNFELALLRHGSKKNNIYSCKKYVLALVEGVTIETSSQDSLRKLCER